MSSLISRIKSQETKPVIKHPDKNLYGIVAQEKQNQRDNRAAAEQNTYHLEIVKDHDGSYYANLTINGRLVAGLPEYVPYRRLKAEIKEYYGIELPRLKDLELKQFGRKWYAHLDGRLEK